MTEVASIPETTSLAALPALRQPFAGGTFCGVITLPDGTHSAVVLLDDKPSNRLTWQGAMDWAASIGGRLPSRPIAALLFTNARPQFDHTAWHWTADVDEDDGSFAWYQSFGYGHQGRSPKSYEARARAVRLIQLTT